MTDLFQDSQLLKTEENLHLTVGASAESAQGVAALPASSGAPPTPESSGSSETRGSIANATYGTDATPLTIHVESSPAANVHRTQPNEVCTPGNLLPPPPGNGIVADELHAQFKRMIAGRTSLPDNVSAMVAFWAISTWFQEAFPVIPCLVITGPAHEAMVVLRVLRDLCRTPTLLAGLRRADLKDLNGHRTLLISEPNLDNRTAALLGILTNRDFILLEQGSYLYCAGSRAVYIGEDPAIHRIQHSLYIDAAARPLAKPPDPSWSLPGTIDNLRQRILEYRDRNMEEARCLTFNPCGLSPEAHAMANALGSCLVDATQLQTELVALLRPTDQQRIADRSDGVEALVVRAAFALCHQDKGEVFVKEIAVEVNRLLVARGETRQLSPGKVGHKLKKVGLYTRRLSQVGNGLTLDQVTTVRIHEVAAGYLGEDSIKEDENLHCPLCEKNKLLRELV
jgi:hypothetical protein